MVCFLVCLFDFFWGFFCNLFNLLGWWDNNNNMKLGFSTELFCMHADLFLFTHRLAVLGFSLFLRFWKGGFREWFVGFLFSEV